MRILLRHVPSLTIVVVLLFVTAHRLPAPIVEEEKPTPAVEQSAKPKAKRTNKTSANDNSERSATRKATLPSRSESTRNPKPFAGTWVEKGKGTTGITIVVSPTQDWAVAKNTVVWGDRGGQAVVEGNTLSWKFMIDKWVMVIAPDGKTAGVTGYGWPGTFRGIFEKVP